MLYDNWLGIRINGVWYRVFMGNFTDAQGFATTKLEIVSATGFAKNLAVDVGNGTLYPVEPNYTGGGSGGLYAGNLDLDIRPYLKTGTNTIDFIIVNGTYSGVGEAKFEVRQYCAPCTEVWTDQCESYEARSL